VPPTVAIASPAAGASVAAGFEVQVNTTDDQCLQKVELVIDGSVVKTLTAGPFTFTTDAGLAKGPHEVQVRSYDAFNMRSATATVTVAGNGNGNGNGKDKGNGNGDSTDGGGGTLSGGCDAGSGSGLLLGLGTLVALRRRRR
jgi:hypothetical protein